MGKRLAVLVGCNYPSTQFRLQGCINDVVDMRNLLLEKFSFHASDVKVLIDEPVQPHSNFATLIPTGANIKAALKRMVDQAEPGDVLVFYFSGHGTVISSLEPGKAYIEHEAIVPCDLNLITDMDLRQLIRRLPKETSFTIVSDSCHSGGLIDKDKEIIGPSTVDRGMSSFYYKPKKINFETILGVLQTVSNVAQAVPEVINTVSNVVQGASEVINTASSIFTGIFSRDVSLSFLPQPDLQKDLKRSLDEKEGILLSGCQENETSADVVGFDGKAYGAFTNALLRVLLVENLSGIISNRQLVVAVRKALNADGFHQHACLYSSEENADAIFLGGSIASRSVNSIASRWRELSGDKNWDRLLHPLDVDLRRYIIHYGQRLGAVGDLFHEFVDSQLFKEKFFEKACLVKGNKFKYKVTHFFYAGSDDVESAWFGYVAVTTDEGKAVLGRRDILVAWRGTATGTEWLNNVKICLTPASELFGSRNDANVHLGFLSLYTGKRPYSANARTSAREQVLDAVTELVNKYKQEEISITITGFSLGAALATLNAMDIVANGYNEPKGNPNKSIMVTAFVFGGPRVGDASLNEFYKKLKLKHNNHLHILRIKNLRDPVPRVPPTVYTHLGDAKLKIDTTKSDYLKSSGIFRDLPDGSTLGNEIDPYSATDRGLADYVSAHNMDVYLHGIAGVQENGFGLVVDHDIALVNKHLNRLKDKHDIPPNWWNGENRKKMVQMEDGHWKVVG